jgi:hypothetical protein
MEETKKKTKKKEAESAKPERASTTRVITDAEVETCLQHLQAIADVLAPYAVTLTTAQRRSTTKLRKGGEKIIPLMGRMAKRAGIASSVVNVEVMQKQVDLANALVPLLAQAKELTDTIGDTVLSANSNAWGSATTLHRVLKAVTERKPKMRRSMQVVSKAFAIQRANAKSAKAPKKSAPTTNGPEPTPPGPAKADEQPTTTA